MKALTEKVRRTTDLSQIEKAKLYNEAAKGAFAENTERARKADWKIFEGWCDENKKISSPASTDTLVTFIDAQSGLIN